MSTTLPESVASVPHSEPGTETAPLPTPVTEGGAAADHAAHDHAAVFDSLQDRTPEWLRTEGSFAFFGLVVAALFFWLSYWPIFHTDVWGHLAYGRLISQQRALPRTEPLMPLSEGVPFVDSAWLSQLVGYQLHAAVGNTAIRFLFALSITLCAALLLTGVFRRTRNPLLAIVAVVVFLALGWMHLQIVRPQLAGMVCSTALLCLLTGRRFPTWGWVAVPALFAVWANVHGSFPVGVAMLGAFAVGRAVDVLRRTGRFDAVVRDAATRRHLLLLQLAVAATLINPYGLGLWAEVVTFARNKNLDELAEWDPLTLRMRQGQFAAAAAIILAVLARVTPRRISATEFLLHLGLGGATLWTSRMIVWWAPVAAWSIALHANAAYYRFVGGRLHLEPVERRSLWTATAFGLVVVSAMLTPFGAAVLHGRKGNEATGLSRQTPIGAVEYLRKNPPQGQIFNSYEFGDYLTWAGPPGLKIFVNSHAHLVPEEVWQHYFTVVNGTARWEETLEQYGVNTVVVDAGRRRDFIRTLKRNEEWKLGYEDNTASVFVRKKPL